jgi:serine-aspartate repeat-containing protein C/D/E
MSIVRVAVLLCLFVGSAHGQSAVQWLHLYGDHASSLFALAPAGEAGWMFCGNRQDTTAANFQWNATFGAINPIGDFRWDKSLGSTTTCFDVIRTTKGYVVGGTTDTSLFPGWHGMDDGFLCLLNEQGGIVWGHAYGGSRHEFIRTVTEAENGDLIFTGFSQSSDGDLKRNGGGQGDFWIGRVRSDGTLLWDTTYGGLGDEDYAYVVELADHTLEVAGSTNSSAFPNGQVKYDYDVYLMHLDSVGHVLSQKQFGSVNNDAPLAIKETSDGNIILACSWASTRAWVAKMTLDGNVLWQTDTDGLPYVFAPSTTLITPDNNIYLAGLDSLYFSTQDTVTTWILKLDSNGHELWHRPFTWMDSAQNVISYPWVNQLTLDHDGELLVAGGGRTHTTQMRHISQGFIAKLSPYVNGVEQIAPPKEICSAIFASGTCVLPIPEHSDRGIARLVNAQGIALRQTAIPLSAQQITFDVFGLSAGLYFAEIVISGHRTMQAVIVE